MRRTHQNGNAKELMAKFNQWLDHTVNVEVLGAFLLHHLYLTSTGLPSLLPWSSGSIKTYVVHIQRSDPICSARHVRKKVKGNRPGGGLELVTFLWGSGEQDLPAFLPVERPVFTSQVGLHSFYTEISATGEFSRMRRGPRLPSTLKVLSGHGVSLPELDLCRVNAGLTTN